MPALALPLAKLSSWVSVPGIDNCLADSLGPAESSERRKGCPLSAPVDDAVNASRQREYVSQIATYREDFRRYLRDLDWADEWRNASFDNTEDELAYHATVLARIYAAGWNRFGWPAESGGLGGTEIHRAVYFEELAAAMLPVPEQHWTLEVLGPAVIKYAPELAERYLPNYMRGGQRRGDGLFVPAGGAG